MSRHAFQSEVWRIQCNISMHWDPRGLITHPPLECALAFLKQLVPSLTCDLDIPGSQTVLDFSKVEKTKKFRGSAPRSECPADNRGAPDKKTPTRFYAFNWVGSWITSTTHRFSRGVVADSYKDFAQEIRGRSQKAYHRNSRVGEGWSNWNPDRTNGQNAGARVVNIHSCVYFALLSCAFCTVVDTNFISHSQVTCNVALAG